LSPVVMVWACIADVWTTLHLLACSLSNKTTGRLALATCVMMLCACDVCITLRHCYASGRLNLNRDRTL